LNKQLDRYKSDLCPSKMKKTPPAGFIAVIAVAPCL
jgi:hypothetical protein